MNGRGRIVTLDQAPMDARLAGDVYDRSGRVLLAAGATLGAATIVSLRQRGVAQVCIEEALSEQELAARRAAVAGRLDRLFRHEQDNPLMMYLHDAVLAYRLEQLQ